MNYRFQHFHSPPLLPVTYSPPLLPVTYSLPLLPVAYSLPLLPVTYSPPLVPVTYSLLLLPVCQINGMHIYLSKPPKRLQVGQNYWFFTSVTLFFTEVKNIFPSMSDLLLFEW